jgi:hypothetical protein
VWVYIVEPELKIAVQLAALGLQAPSYTLQPRICIGLFVSFIWLICTAIPSAKEKVGG